MGKCKKRTLRNNSASFFMTREEAVNSVFRLFSEKSKKYFDIKSAINTISLFGLSAEELSEAGMAYENLKALGSMLN